VLNEGKPGDFRVYRRPASLSSQTGGIGRLSAHGKSLRSKREESPKQLCRGFHLVCNDCNPSVLAVQGYHRFESEWKCCVSLKGVTVNRVYALRQAKMMTVAVMPQRQADHQIHHPQSEW
jgi:hypothetical protein